MNVFHLFKSKLFVFVVQFSNKNQTFFIICEIVLKTNINSPTLNYDFYLSINQTQLYSKL